MDLKADQKVSFALRGKDEMGNLTGLPEGVEVSYEVDNTAVVTLTEDGTGGATVAATGLLGVSMLTGTATLDGVAVATAVAAVQVVPGDAETFALEFGTPEEVTPDEPVEPAEPAEPVV